MISIREAISTILKQRPAIYGVLAIWVMLFHIANRIGVPGTPGIITPLVNMGNVAVDVFLLLSGYCVYESWKKDPSIKRFYFKRFLRILVPYLIFSIPLYLWKNVVEVKTFNPNAIIGDVSTYNFWVYGMQTTWYVCAILLFYLLIPILGLLMKKNKFCGIIVLVAIYVLNQVLWMLLPSYSVTSIAWTRLPVFALGVFLSCHGDTIEVKKPKVVKYALVLLAVLFTMIFPYREWYRNVFGNKPEYLWTGYILLAPGLLIILFEVVRRLPGFVNKGLELIGSVSLEIYIIHVFALRVLDYYKLQTVLNAWYFVIVPVATIGIALVYYYIKTLIKHGIKRTATV